MLTRNESMHAEAWREMLDEYLRARSVCTGERFVPFNLVDGNVARSPGLRGKPSPDTYLTAARMLGAPPSAATVFEDTFAGFSAGREGGFAFVVGVNRVVGFDRSGQARRLRACGADIVVADLADLLCSA
ncbi:HAD-IA family hydrolase [Segniliparus rotundus]